MFYTLKSLWKDESGATAIEYGLIGALVSVTAMGALTAMGGSLNALLAGMSTDIAGAVPTP